MRDTTLAIIGVIVAVIGIVIAVAYFTAPFDEPKVYQGTVTKTYIIPGDAPSTGIGTDSKGNPITISNPGTPDKFYVVLNSETRIHVNQETFDALVVGDRVKFIFYSRANYEWVRI